MVSPPTPQTPVVNLNATPQMLQVDTQAMLRDFPSIYQELSGTRYSNGLDEVVQALCQGLKPTDSQLCGLVDLYHDRFYCCLPSCRKEYDRLDRARDHFLMAHLGGCYKCPEW